MDAAATLPEVLAQIVTRSATLTERLSGSYRPLPAPQDELTSQNRLDHWREMVNGAESNLFTRRLEAARLDEASVRPLLGPVGLKEGQPFPAWTETLRQILAPGNPYLAGEDRDSQP